MKNEKGKEIITDVAPDLVFWTVIIFSLGILLNVKMFNFNIKLFQIITHKNLPK